MSFYRSHGSRGGWYLESIDLLFSSPSFCLFSLLAMSVLTASLGWNFAVDCYVAKYGQEVKAPILMQHRSQILSGNHRSSSSFKVAIFPFFGTEHNDRYHLFFRFEPFSNAYGNQSAALTYRPIRNYARDGYGELTVCYLADSPGTFVAREDLGRFMVQPLLFVFGCMGLFWVSDRFLKCFPGKRSQEIVEPEEASRYESMGVRSAMTDREFHKMLSSE